MRYLGLWVNKKGSKGGGRKKMKNNTNKGKRQNGADKVEGMKELDANCNLKHFSYTLR